MGRRGAQFRSRAKKSQQEVDTVTEQPHEQTDENPTPLQDDNVSSDLKKKEDAADNNKSFEARSSAKTMHEEDKNDDSEMYTRDVDNKEKDQVDQKQKQMDRSNGSKYTKEEIEDMLDENKDKDVKDNMFVTLAIKVFSFFFPAAVRNFVSSYVSCVGGLLVFILVVAMFFYLYWLFGFCDYQKIETSEIPDNQIWCKERYLAQQLVLGLDIAGEWSTESGYDRRDGGPWQLNFKGFQANEDIFDSTIDQVLNKSDEFVNDMYDRPFFEILQQSFFYNPELQGLTGAAVLETNIQLATVFDNYNIRGFTTVDLKEEIQENWEKYRYARVNSSWDKLTEVSPCENWESDVPDFAFENRLICRPSADYNQERVAEHWLQGTQVRTLASNFYPILVEHLFPGSNFSLGYRDAQTPIKIDWDFSMLFGYDYCNVGGLETCESLLYKSNSLGPGGPDAFKDDPYFGISDYIELLNQQRQLIPADAYDKSIAERTVYINNLRQFGFFLGKDFIFRPEDSDTTEDDSLFQKSGKSVEYIIVPQMTLATPNLDQTQILGETYFVCESCQERERYLQLVNNNTESIAGLCKKSAYVYLHLYAYTFDFNLTDTGIESLSTELNVEDHYVTTFLYRLDSSGDKYSYFTHNFRDKDSLFYYNDLLSEVKELHCDASEWRYGDDLNISVPFTLTTGIYTCEVEFCESTLQKLGDAQANVQLFYLALLLVIVTIFICIILPQARSKDKEKREKFADMLFESITGVADNV
eukprot:TRINITY_DN3531_c0_g1_i7.p1 TRINITY_DN3531_c0_g1~~TRINITY_DN3531_c0_g1_i7.p1  ORF type:complete len:755 (-),score=79.79 TRINITY_DN3531_c0_g1_i7:761-3025(-)